MKLPYFILLLNLLFVRVQAQNNAIEISGTIAGTYNSRMYIFFDGEIKEKISTPITDGKFHFTINRQGPVLARLHLDQKSLLWDVYIEGANMEIACTNEMKIDKDTFNMFFVTAVKGSRTEELKRNFESWLDKLKKSGQDEKAVNEQYYQQLLAVVQNNPGSKVSPYLIGKATSLPIEKLETLTKLVSPALAGTFEVKQAEKLLTRRRYQQEHIVIGDAFKNFALVDKESHTVNLEQYKGRYLYIVLWGSHCAPCIKEQPNIKALFGNKDVEILSISTDRDLSKWITTLSGKDLPWPQALDKNDAIMSYYGIEAIPCHILLDKDGKIFKWDLQLERLENMMAGKELN
ncbi:redoxin family protein [Niastella sp. OAS944]|uniref:redoxin family protein n=1 Tax=Niastella sp. OAS944 TaxID=2664089 RepID=UPI003497AFA0|nr:peroxiredoxin [Chitinophagaceae bacterium OAS944]